MSSEILVEVTRGQLRENIIRGHVAVVNGQGLAAYAGNTDYLTYMRSCAKPLQAAAAVECGAIDHFHITEPELAVMCSSHIGADYHVAAIESILAKIGLDENAFTLGADLSLEKKLREQRIREGIAPRKIFNNCSGKHACMLALCRYYDWDHSAYQAPDHPVQQLIKSAVAAYCQMNEDDIIVGVDGCGVPVFGMPLINIAKSYYNLLNPEQRLSPERTAASHRLTQAMIAHPEMVEGWGNFTTELIHTTGGRILGKLGADAVYTCAPMDGSVAMAVKIEDGQIPMLSYVVISVLTQLGLLSAAEQQALSSYAASNNLNCNKDVVGQVRPVFKLHLS